MNDGYEDYPEQSQLVTFKDIYTRLTLDDSPHLGFTYKGEKCVIQTSHLAEEELLSIPGIADSLWCYRYTTSEWIPVFDYVGEGSIEMWVDIEPCTDEYMIGNWWVTPKGFPREQYF